MFLKNFFGNRPLLSSVMVLLVWLVLMMILALLLLAADLDINAVSFWTGVVAATGLGFLVVIGVILIYQTGHQLDPLLKPLGFRGKSLHFLNRIYQGKWKNRKIRMEFHVAKGLYPNRLHINVPCNTPAKKEIIIGQRKPILINDSFNRLVEIPDDYEELQVWATDHKWGQIVISDEKAAEAVLEAVVAEVNAETFIKISDNCVYLRGLFLQIEQEQIECWLDAATELAQRLEELVKA